MGYVSLQEGIVSKFLPNLYPSSQFFPLNPVAGGIPAKLTSNDSGMSSPCMDTEGWCWDGWHGSALAGTICDILCGESWKGFRARPGSI